MTIHEPQEQCFELMRMLLDPTGEGLQLLAEPKQLVDLFMFGSLTLTSEENA